MCWFSLPLLSEELGAASFFSVHLLLTSEQEVHTQYLWQFDVLSEAAAAEELKSAVSLVPRRRRKKRNRRLLSRGSKAFD